MGINQKLAHELVDIIFNNEATKCNLKGKEDPNLVGTSIEAADRTMYTIVIASNSAAGLLNQFMDQIGPLIEAADAAPGEPTVN